MRNNEFVLANTCYSCTDSPNIISQSFYVPRFVREDRCQGKILGHAKLGIIAPQHESIFGLTRIGRFGTPSVCAGCDITEVHV